MVYFDIDEGTASVYLFAKAEFKETGMRAWCVGRAMEGLLGGKELLHQCI